MNFKIQAVSALLLMSTLTAINTQAQTTTSTGDQFLDVCVQAIQGKGYRGGGMQTVCEGTYVLPSPLLVRCTHGMNLTGEIEDAKLRQICQIHCEFKGYFGPYPDYPRDLQLEIGRKLMETLASTNRCSELGLPKPL